MALSEGKFNEKEKRNTAFKALFGILNSTSTFGINEESFPKGRNVFLSDIINEEDSIPFIVKNNEPIDESDGDDGNGIIFDVTSTTSNLITNPDNEVKPAVIRNPHVALNLGSMTRHQAIISSSFPLSSSTTNFSDPNIHVEQIIIPLTRVNGTNGQMYAAFAPDHEISSIGASADLFKNPVNTDGDSIANTTTYTSTGGFIEAKPLKLVTSQSSILKNFIDPFKFGSGYKARVFAADPNLGALNNGVGFSTQGEVPESGQDNVFEGWVFDYKEGILTIGADGDDGDLPDQNNLFATYPHPLYLRAFRYIGPTGFKHPSSSMTASNMQINENLNVDGTISLQGFNFVDTELISTSGSSIFGDNVSEDTHTFTGSVFITGGLFVDGESTAGGSGRAGINPIVFNTISSSDFYDNYLETTLEPTNELDVIEYSSSLGLKLSSSIGTGNYIVLNGSGSANLITKPIRSGDSVNSSPFAIDIDVSNQKFSIDPQHDLFFFSSSINKPILSSFGPFKTSINNTESTHSFSFVSESYVGKIGIYFSKNSPLAPLIENINEPIHSYIQGIQLSGSKDGETYVPLFSKNNISNEVFNGDIPGETFTPGDSLFPQLNDFGIASNNTNLSSTYIAHFTSSVINTNNDLGIPQKYKFYKLHVSGGYLGGTETDFFHFIHHIDFYENKTPTAENRKQVTIKFDDTQDPNKPVGITKFDTEISKSIEKIGIAETPAPEASFMFLGVAQTDGDFNNFNLGNINELRATSSIIENNLLVRNEVSSSILRASDRVSTDRIFSRQIRNSGSLIQSGNLFLTSFPVDAAASPPSASIILEELNPIYFTNFKTDGSKGVDEFSGRIFGHHTDDNVSDIYIDAFRIYNISDVEQRIETLDPVNGIIHLTSSKIHLDGDVTASGNISASGTINASEYRINGDLFTGGGSGFPHDEASLGFIANITGSLIISGNENTNPHIALGDTTSDQFLLNQQPHPHTQDPILHNHNGALYWGANLIGAADAVGTTITNGNLGSNFDLSSFNISGSGNISINGNLSASGELVTNNITASGFLNINTEENADQSDYQVLVKDPTTGIIYHTGSYGVGSSTTPGNDDDLFVVSDFLMTSSRNLAVTGNLLLTNDIFIEGDIKINNTKSLSIDNVENVLKVGGEGNFKKINFELDNAPRLTIFSNNVGIGVNEPKHKLDVRGDIVTTGMVSSSDKLFANLSPNTSNNIVSYNEDTGELNNFDLSNFVIENDNALSVDPVNTPFSSSLDQITVQRDTGDIFTSTMGVYFSGSLVDGLDAFGSDQFEIVENGIPSDGSNETVSYFVEFADQCKIFTKQTEVFSKGINISFAFKEPVIVSQFRQEFIFANNYFLPEHVEIYGSNASFNGIDEGILLAEGMGFSTDEGNVLDQSNPTYLRGGEFQFASTFIDANLKRTSSIPETSLTQSFQFYRIRYSGSFHGNSWDGTQFTPIIPEEYHRQFPIIIAEITPVTRSFTVGATSSFENGIITTNQVITNHLIGTASHATYAELAGSASNGFPYIGSEAIISGGLSVSGCVELNCLEMSGDVDLNNYSIINGGNISSNNAEIGNIISNTINTHNITTHNINVGVLPSSSIGYPGCIDTTGPITITTIVTSSLTESYSNNKIKNEGKLSVQRKDGDINAPSFPLELTSSLGHYLVASGSSGSLIDGDENSSIIVNQNTLLFPFGGSPQGLAQLQELYHDLSSSFYIRFELPEPVLMDEFRFNFINKTEATSFIPSSNSASLSRENLTMTTDWTAGGSPFSATGENAALLDKLGILINDVSENSPFFNPDGDPFLYYAGSGNPPTPASVLTLQNWIDGSGGNVGWSFPSSNPEHNFPLPEGDPNDFFSQIGLDRSVWGKRKITFFGSGDFWIAYEFEKPTIVDRYKIFGARGFTATSQFRFEGSNDGTNYTVLDSLGVWNQSMLSNDTLPVGFEPMIGHVFHHDRGTSSFTNLEPFKYYRFRVPDGVSSIILSKIALYTASEARPGTTNYNPEYIDIFTHDELGESEVGSGLSFTNPILHPFAHYPGTNVGSFTVNSSDGVLSASLTQFNTDNGNPLAKYFTVRLSGSFNESNLSGLSEIQPVTRSFTTHSFIMGEGGLDTDDDGGLYWPTLPLNPDNIECSDANVVYYNPESGQFYYTSSCGGSNGGGGSNNFTSIFVDEIKENTPGNNINVKQKLVAEKGLKLEPSFVTQHNSDKLHLLAFDDTSGEIFKARNSFDGNTQTEFDGDVQVKANLSLTGSLDAHRAIIGISGSEKRAFNQGKLDDFFINSAVETERYSLYVRNGATIIGGDIIPDVPDKYSLGNDRFQFKSLHIEKGSIHFYSGSSEISGSSKKEVGKITVNEFTNEIEFRSGSEFSPVRVKELRSNEFQIGSGTSSSVQIASSDGAGNRGFVAVSARPDGFASTVFRAEDTSSQGAESGMAGIEVKGSGSFKLMLDHDNNPTNAKFIVEAGGAIPGLGTRLFSVSESGETRAYDYLKADNYITTTNITSSGVVSASQFIGNSYMINDDHIFAQFSSGFGSIEAGTIVIGDVSTPDPLLLIGDSINLSSNKIQFTGAVTASGNISGSHVTTASFGSLQLSNLPTSPTGLPTGSVWVSGSKNDASTNNVNCGTLMIVI